MSYYYRKMDSPTGTLTLVAGDPGLAAILWERDDPSALMTITESGYPDHPLLLETELQLKEYFDKKRKDFTLPLDLKGSVFQLKVWEALLTIPFGITRTYGQIARQIGQPDAVRAVGAAANKNPVPVIVPCHRVIGASGQLVGFGGGLHNKALLLDLEQSQTTLTLW